MVMMVLALQATIGRAFLFIFIVFDDFRLRSYKKLQKETLGKARKSGAEGESLKLLSEFKCLLFDFSFESDVFDSNSG
jgi:hypothetical protein